MAVPTVPGVAPEPPRTPVPMPLVAPQASAARSSAAVSAGFLVTTVLGGVLALLVALLVGEGPDTDAFFAAYSLYMVFIIFGSSLRIVLVPLMGAVDGESALRAAAENVLRRLTGAAVVAVAVVIALSPVLGPLLTPGAPADAQVTASGTLAILAVASYGQIAAAGLSAVLAAGRRYTASAVLYVASSTVTVGVATVLMLRVGIVGAALGVLVGALTLYAAHVAYLRRFGFTAPPGLRTTLRRQTGRLVARAAGGAAFSLGAQASLSLALAAVSGVVGAVTAYSYAYFLATLLLSVTAASIVFVSMPSLVDALRAQGPAAARAYLRSMGPLALYLYLPLAGAYAFLARPILHAVLGEALGAATLDLLWDASRLFLLMGVSWALLTPVMTLALAQRRFRGLALLAGSMVALQAAVVLPLSKANPVLVAAGHAAVGMVVVLVALVMVFGRDAARAGVEALAVSAPAFGLALVFPLLALSGLGAAGWGAALGTAALGVLAYVTVGAVTWPSVGGRAVRELRART